MLAKLFPFLGQIQLPLYLMREQVSIELYFETGANKRFCFPKGGTDPVSVTIDTEETKLVADYIYYPQQVMDNYETQIRSKGLTIPFLEYALVKTSVAKDASNNITLIRNVGGANRIVSKVVVTNANPAFSKETLYNEYGSDCGASFELNLKYNDRFLYPRPITNFGHAFNQVHNAEGMPLFVTAAEYSEQQKDLMTAAKFEGYAMNDISDRQRRTYFAIKLDGSRVNSAGIELHLKMTGQNANLVSRVYLEQACVLTLQDGKMTKTYA